MDYNILIRVRADGTAEATQQLNNLDNATRGLTSSANTFGSTLQKLGGILTSVFAVTQLVSWGKQAISTAQDMERLTNMLGVMVGNAEATERALGRIREMELGIASIDLKSGIESVTAFMRMGKPEEMAESYTAALGKAVDYYGGTSQQVSLAIAQLEQLSGKTSGFGEDLRSLSNSLPGVKKMLTEAFGVSSVEEINELGVTGSEVVDTLIAKFNELPQVPVGIAGTFAQLQAKVTEIFTKIGDDIAPFISNLAETFLPVVEYIGTGFSNWIKQLQEMPGFQDIMNNIAESCSILAKAVFDIISSKPIMDMIQTLLLGSSDILVDMSQIIGDIVKLIMDMKPLWETINFIIKAAMLGVMAICKSIQWLLSKVTGGKIKAPDWSSLEKVALGPEQEAKKTEKKAQSKSSSITAPVTTAAKKQSEKAAKEQEAAAKKTQKEREKAYKQMVKSQEDAYKKMYENTKKFVSEGIKAQSEAVKNQINSLTEELNNRKSFVNDVKSEIDRLRGIEQEDADKRYKALTTNNGAYASGINHTVAQGPITQGEIFTASANLMRKQAESNALSNYIDKTLYGTSTDKMVSQKSQLENRQDKLEKAHENIDKITETVIKMQNSLANLLGLAKQDMGVRI